MKFQIISFSLLFLCFFNTGTLASTKHNIFENIKEQQIAAFYEIVEAPAWFDNNGELNNKGSNLLSILENSYKHGLNPKSYGINILDFNDELLTKAALKYVRDLNTGQRAPKELDPELYIYPREIESGEVLADIYKKRNIEKAFQRLEPQYREYRILKETLDQYRKIRTDGGWDSVSFHSSLRPGDDREGVTNLKLRLFTQGYLSAESNSTIYDEELVVAVQNFQEHHGLDTDGIVGPRTIAALNVPVEERINQIIINMERWRWLPDNLGKRHIRVNIAGFYLKLQQDNDVIIEMPVIVGRPYRKTPIFSTFLTDVIFNPHWHVPVSIAFSSIIPDIIKDRRYLSRQHFEVLKREQDGQLRLVSNPESLPWETFSRRNFPYLLRQKPGTHNALGHVRFSIKNDMSIFLHGTPDQGLFSQSARANSSGCIRLEKPFELLQYVLNNNSALNENEIRDLYFQYETSSTMRPRTVKLKQEIPVHLLYWTAFVGEAEQLYFYDDIYKRDSVLIKALEL